MSATTRVNGSGQYLTGTIVSVVQLKAFIIDVGADLQAQDDGIDEAVEQVIREIQPLMYFTPTAGDGIIHVIVDGHSVDADTLQLRIRALDTGAGYRYNAATVVLGTSITVA
jgi:hypothetical protein